MIDAIRWLGLPAAASAHANALDNATLLVHLLMLVLFIGWGAFFVYMLVRFRKGAHPTAVYSGAQGNVSTYLEFAILLAEVFLLVGFSIPLWAERVERFPLEKDATVIRVTGEQFAWNIHYAGADGKFGRTDITKINVQSNPLGLDRTDPAAKDDIVTLNQMHALVNKPVLVHLQSKDVIHSFALQEMRVKQDAIPGLSIPVWFTPTVTTEEMRKIKGLPEWNYEIACAQLCGIGHSGMRGFVVIDTPESWKTWMDKQIAQLPAEGDEEWQ